MTVKGVVMAKDSPDKPAEKGMSKDIEKEKPQKPSPSAAGKKSARSKKTTAKSKTAPKTVRPRSKGKTNAAGEKKVTKPKSPPPKRQAAAAEAKKTSAKATQKIETKDVPKKSSSADTSAVLPPTNEEPDTMNKMLFYGGGILALFVFLIVAASLQNMGKYEIIDNNGVVEVWKGRFSPIGRDLMISMTGVKPPSQMKANYTCEEVYPIVFQYYLNQSDSQMAAAGSPGFEEIKSSLKRAGKFASTTEDRALIDNRLKAIDRTVLIYKADVAAARGTTEGLQTARVYLNKAATLNPDEIESSLIQQKLGSVQKQMQALRPNLAGKPETPPETDVPPPDPKTDGHKGSETAPADKPSAPIGGGTT